MDFGPKSIFSSKDAANWRKSVDSFFVGKTSYYMVTPATSFCDADSNLEKLVGGGRVNQCRQKTEGKLFIWYRALPRAMKLLPAYFLRTTCARDLQKNFPKIRETYPPKTFSPAARWKTLVKRGQKIPGALGVRRRRTEERAAEVS